MALAIGEHVSFVTADNESVEGTILQHIKHTDGSVEYEIRATSDTAKKIYYQTAESISAISRSASLQNPDASHLTAAVSIQKLYEARSLTRSVAFQQDIQALIDKYQV